jgi:hypothetical protein
MIEVEDGGTIELPEEGVRLIEAWIKDMKL